MRSIRILGLSVLTCMLAIAAAGQGYWTPLTNQPCQPGQPCFYAGTAFLMTDGTVLVQNQHGTLEYGNWYRLTPDSSGSYINGTWSQVASMPSGYGPLFYASAVLADGRLIVEGGEYNLGQGGAETNLGAIFDPTANSWMSVSAPTGWMHIGDAPGVLLPSDKFLIGNIGNTDEALLDPTTLTWSSTGAGKYDFHSEEGFTLLPGGDVLDVDTKYVYPPTDHSERYSYLNGSWSNAGSTLNQLYNSSGLSSEYEIGPATLLANGTVFAAGASTYDQVQGCPTAHNSIYNPSGQGSWVTAPDDPMPAGVGLEMNDKPAALLPNGNLMLLMTNCDNYYVVYYYEWDGSSFVPVPNPPNASPSGTFLVLPTGQVLLTDRSSNAYVYIPTGRPNPAWQPTISPGPPNPIKVVQGATYQVYGTQFNGLSQGTMYGDDVQNATNYPLVRVTTLSQGVTYWKTHDHSTMDVATRSQLVYTEFDVPATMPVGNYNIQIVANGIASPPYALRVCVPGGCQ